MFKKLTGAGKSKREFIERAAGVHPCNLNCYGECLYEEVNRLTLLAGLDQFL